jgi:hypothetical protein
MGEREDGPKPPPSLTLFTRAREPSVMADELANTSFSRSTQPIRSPRGGTRRVRVLPLQTGTA